MIPSDQLLVVKPGTTRQWMDENLPANACKFEEFHVSAREAAAHLRILTGSISVLRALHGAVNPPRKLCLHFVSTDPEALAEAGLMVGVEVLDLRFIPWQRRLRELAVGANSDQETYNHAA